MAPLLSVPGLTRLLPFCFLLSACGCASTFVGPLGEKRPECVVLLHGLARTSLSMNKLQDALLRAGYAVCNYDYPSRKADLEELAETVVDEAVASCRRLGAGRFHFVTHSMGGIVLRQYLADRQLEGLGRVVMLSPPNQGTEVIDWLGHNPVFTWLYGPAANQLGTDERGLPGGLGRVDFELGVITGRRSVNPILSMIIEGPDDGKVSVARARVPGMKDFAVVDTSHPFIMRDDEVIGLVLRFLATGSFSAGKAVGTP